MNGDGTNGTLSIAGELLGILQANGKRFMILSALEKKMGASLRRRLGLTGKKLSAPSLKKILDSHLGDALEIRQNSRRYSYLVAIGDPRELIVDFIRENPGKQVGGLASSLPFKKAEFLSLLNELMKAGRLYPHLKDDYKARFFASEPQASASVSVKNHAPAPTSQNDAVSGADAPDREKEQFFAAFRGLDRGRVFVRIPDLRRALGWPREVFDGVLRALRDGEAVQLHAGDVTLMTPEEVEDCFVDEFGSRKGTVTLRK